MLSLVLVAVGCGAGPSDPGVQVATQSPEGNAELPPSSTETTAVVDSPPVPESTTTSVTVARAAKPNPTPTTTAITATPATTSATRATTTTTGRPVTVTTQPAGPTVVDLGMRPSGRGGWMVRTDGTVIPVGDAPMLGDAAGQLTSKAIDLIPTVSGNGYWIIGLAGDVIARGDAVSAGNLTSIPLNSPIAGMAPDLADGKGYWLVAEDGGIFAFDAPFHGSGGSTSLSKPVIAFAGTPGTGYWMTTSAGQVLPFGDATFYGDTKAIPINRPIVDMAPTPSGTGYYLLADGGGFYSFGEATFYGSTGSLALNSRVVSLAVTPTGKGYWVATADGSIFPFGDAADLMP
jgi:hypothetical protein